MKTTYLLLSLLIVILFSCKKEELPQPIPKPSKGDTIVIPSKYVDSTLIGTWLQDSVVRIDTTYLTRDVSHSDLSIGTTRFTADSIIDEWSSLDPYGSTGKREGIYEVNSNKTFIKGPFTEIPSLYEADYYEIVGNQLRLYCLPQEWDQLTILYYHKIK